jgi:hypothetical protein
MFEHFAGFSLLALGQDDMEGNPPIHPNNPSSLAKAIVALMIL